MTWTEAQRQLAQVKIEVISTKHKLKKIIETPELNIFFIKEKKHSEILIETISSVIDQIHTLEKK